MCAVQGLIVPKYMGECFGDRDLGRTGRRYRGRYRPIEANLFRSLHFLYVFGTQVDLHFNMKGDVSTYVFDLCSAVVREGLI